MRPWVFSLFAMANLATSLNAGEMYRCEKDGSPVFSDKPCGPSATSIQIKEQPTIDGGESEGAGEGAALTAKADRASAERKIREYERRIAKHQKDMDRDLTYLKSSKRKSANNLAGATRDVGISNEMNAVTEKYKAMIETERAQIELLQRRLSSSE